MALEMLKHDFSLATKRDKNKKTALHLFALIPSAFDNESPEGWSKLFKSAYLNIGFKRRQKQSKAVELVKCLWGHTLLQGHDQSIDLISKPTKLVFEATKVGNFEFLAALIGSYPDLIWETDSQNGPIINIGILYGHANIFNLIHEIGGIKADLAAKKDTETNNNILHLAAKLPSPERLNVVSGAALQMQQELLWFQEVKRIVPPKEQEKKAIEIFTSQWLSTLLMSRYSEYDFLKWLPVKFMVGLTTLFFSMVTMMIAFSFAFVLACYHQHRLKLGPFLISMLGIVPIALFSILKFPLLLETFSTYCSGKLFQTSRPMF
ncbi:uncharacterized protein LOC133799842 [Humulus lupulus]|uniref:uncharacterized protein LOC133799842 n=1 Tax=Humulus lupulus TaxID=3486 RepID=UPI002B40B153|nr:uncharacterized protein LOC133799842 [Humulus lupulus]